MKECLLCGKEFTPKNPKGKYCSDSCRQKVYRQGIKEIVSKSRMKEDIKPTVKESLLAEIEGIEKWKIKKPILQTPKGLVGIQRLLWLAENKPKT